MRTRPRFPEVAARVRDVTKQLDGRTVRCQRPVSPRYAAACALLTDQVAAGENKPRNERSTAGLVDRADHERSAARHLPHQLLVGQDVDGAPYRANARPVWLVGSLSDGSFAVMSPDRIRSRRRAASCRYGCSGDAESMYMIGS
jgi:hypothetical protein